MAMFNSYVGLPEGNIQNRFEVTDVPPVFAKLAQYFIIHCDT